MRKIKYINGAAVVATPTLSRTSFPESNVEPDSAYTIRKIYDCWIKGKPTSPHIFDCEFDEEGRGFDNSDSYDDFRENPIDRTQVMNDIEDARRDFEEEVVSARERRRLEKAQKAQTTQPKQPTPSE